MKLVYKLPYPNAPDKARVESWRLNDNHVHVALQSDAVLRVSLTGGSSPTWYNDVTFEKPLFNPDGKMTDMVSFTGIVQQLVYYVEYAFTFDAVVVQDFKGEEIVLFRTLETGGQWHLVVDKDIRGVSFRTAHSYPIGASRSTLFKVKFIPEAPFDKYVELAQRQAQDVYNKTNLWANRALAATSLLAYMTPSIIQFEHRPSAPGWILPSSEYLYRGLVIHPSTWPMLIEHIVNTGFTWPTTSTLLTWLQDVTADSDSLSLAGYLLKYSNHAVLMVIVLRSFPALTRFFTNGWYYVPIMSDEYHAHETAIHWCIVDGKMLVKTNAKPEIMEITRFEHFRLARQQDLAWNRAALCDPTWQLGVFASLGVLLATYCCLVPYPSIAATYLSTVDVQEQIRLMSRHEDLCNVLYETVGNLTQGHTSSSALAALGSDSLQNLLPHCAFGLTLNAQIKYMTTELRNTRMSYNANAMRKYFDMLSTLYNYRNYANVGSFLTTAVLSLGYIQPYPGEDIRVFGTQLPNVDLDEFRFRFYAMLKRNQLPLYTNDLLVRTVAMHVNTMRANATVTLDVSQTATNDVAKLMYIDLNKTVALYKPRMLATPALVGQAVTPVSAMTLITLLNRIGWTGAQSNLVQLWSYKALLVSTNTLELIVPALATFCQTVILKRWTTLDERAYQVERDARRYEQQILLNEKNFNQTLLLESWRQKSKWQFFLAPTHETPADLAFASAQIAFSARNAIKTGIVAFSWATANPFTALAGTAVTAATTYAISDRVASMLGMSAAPEPFNENRKFTISKLRELYFETVLALSNHGLAPELANAFRDLNSEYAKLLLDEYTLRGDAYPQTVDLGSSPSAPETEFLTETYVKMVTPPGATPFPVIMTRIVSEMQQDVASHMREQGVRMLPVPPSLPTAFQPLPEGERVKTIPPVKRITVMETVKSVQQDLSLHMREQGVRMLPVPPTMPTTFQPLPEPPPQSEPRTVAQQLTQSTPEDQPPPSFEFPFPIMPFGTIPSKQVTPLMPKRTGGLAEQAVHVLLSNEQATAEDQLLILAAMQRVDMSMFSSSIVAPKQAPPAGLDVMGYMASFMREQSYMQFDLKCTTDQAEALTSILWPFQTMATVTLNKAGASLMVFLGTCNVAGDVFVPFKRVSGKLANIPVPRLSPATFICNMNAIAAFICSTVEQDVAQLVAHMTSLYLRQLLSQDDVRVPSPVDYAAF